MRQRLIDHGLNRTYIVVLETGDEVADTLARFAHQNQLTAASFKAIGALSDARLGWFDWESKKYRTAAELQEQVEVLSLIGDVALKDGKPVVHAHLIVGKKDGTAHGGHLMEAHVRPTLEVVLTEMSEPLRKAFDEESGLDLIRP